MNGGIRAFTLWLTGLPCSGKTSLGDLISDELAGSGHTVEHLDGDAIRKGLCKDLGFSKADRITNIERTAFIASLLTRNGVVTIVSFVSPYRQMRQDARHRISPSAFIEVYVRCPLAVCEQRDVKGMYRLARAGQIRDFTGVSDPYEEPIHPEIIVDTDKEDLRVCADRILSYLESRNFLISCNPFPASPLVTKAYRLASYHHRGQTRKGGDIPYITHPVAVAEMLQRAGYDENVIAAGLLHDLLEDTACDREEMEKAVGPEVTAIVLEITEGSKLIPWQERKGHYLRVLETASPEALVVSCADKIHNIKSLLEGLAAEGDKFIASFAGGLNEKIANYGSIYELVAHKCPSCRLLPLYAEHLERLKRKDVQFAGKGMSI